MRIESPEDFRSPRLAQFLEPSFYDLDEGDQRPLIRRADLQAAQLPADYHGLTAEGRRLARWSVLSAWYDRSRPQVVCTDLEALVAAMYLWVEHYIKPATYNAGRYFNRDPKHKYQMIRAGFAPPRVETEPAKNLITAPRMSTKTDTFIHQACTLFACTRPYTSILISEINRQLTETQMQLIRMEVEQNEFIRGDFGGSGQLYPRSNRDAEKWGNEQLDFLHMPGNSIQGTSFYSAIRGKHPPIWIVDDPESDGNVREKGHKQEFVMNLFPRGLGMMTRGGQVLVIQTRIPGGVIDVAMRSSERGDEDWELIDLMGQNRWDDWNRVNFDLLVSREDGTIESIYPDHVSVEGFEAKKRSLGARAALAEYRGIAIPEGSLVFDRDPYRHGYMRCRWKADVPGEMEDYLFDLRTGVIKPWAEFLASLTIVGACDLADSTKPDADFSCFVLVGVDPFGIHYVLDCFMKRIQSEQFAQYVFAMAASFPQTEAIGWEAGTFQNVVLRFAERYRRELERQGLAPPPLVPILNVGKQKTARIVATLRGPFENDEIRFPTFVPSRDAAGELHTPVENSNRLYFLALFDQIDTFTDDGPADHDDGPDALQMAMRLLVGRRGEAPVQEDPNARVARRYEEAGIVLDPLRMSDDLRRELGLQPEIGAALTNSYDEYTEIDPYAHT